jgi:hypothetical protein
MAAVETTLSVGQLQCRWQTPVPMIGVKAFETRHTENGMTCAHLRLIN